MRRRVGVFATNSYTEIALGDFLLKVQDEFIIDWDVRIPQCSPINSTNLNYSLNKPPKVAIFGLDSWYPPRIDGQSGTDLIDLVIKFFAANPSYLDFYHAILVEDDLDDHTQNKGPEYDIELVKNKLQQGIREVCPEKSIPPIYVLLAVPEVESWFIADWEQSFGRVLLDSVSRQFHSFVKTLFLNEATGGNIERYNLGCKLSYKIETELDRIVISMVFSDNEILQFRDQLCYRKEAHKTQKMLASIRPDIVANMCTDYFEPTYKQLKAL